MSTPKLQPTDFFEAGVHILDVTGFSALTSVALCDVLHVTRGSFYHHFDSFETFLHAFLVYWEQVYVRSPIEVLESEASFHRRSELSIDIASDYPHRVEIALRAWSATNPTVAGFVNRLDAVKVKSTESSLLRAGCDKQLASLYAQLTISVLAGLEIRELTEDRALFRSLFREIEWSVRRRLEEPQAQSATCT